MNNVELNADTTETVSFPTIDTTGVGGLKQESKVLDFVKINRDLDMNPRKATAYSLEKSGWMGRDLYLHGQLEPVLVSQREDGSLHLLRGFIRLTGANHVRTTGIPAVKGDTVNQPAIEADPNFMSKVNALVIKGLSRAQEIDLVMDHGTKTGLSVQEKYQSAKIMTANGFSRALISSKLGFKNVSNYNNQIGRILNLPQIVEDNFLSTDKNAVKITQDNLKLLYPAFETDQKQPGAKFKVGGDTFNAAWEKIVLEGNAQRAKSMSRDDIKSVANTVQNPDVRDILQAIHDNDGQGLASAINKVETSIRLTTTYGTGFTRTEANVTTDRQDTIDLIAETDLS